MKRLLIGLTLLLLSPALAQTNDRAPLNGKFGNATLLARWQRHDVVGGCPGQWKAPDVQNTSLAPCTPSRTVPGTQKVDSTNVELWSC